MKMQLRIWKMESYITCLQCQKLVPATVIIGIVPKEKDVRQVKIPPSYKNFAQDVFTRRLVLKLGKRNPDGTGVIVKTEHDCVAGHVKDITSDMLLEFMDDVPLRQEFLQLCAE